jgi:hypothetical protein
MKRTIETTVINRVCPERRLKVRTTKQATTWLTVDGLKTVRAHVALSGMDIVADVAKALVGQYGRSEAAEMVSHLYDESRLQPEVHRYVENLIAVL